MTPTDLPRTQSRSDHAILEHATRDSQRSGGRPIADHQQVRRLYDGSAGAWLRLGSVASLHQPLIGRILRRGDLRIRHARNVLDVGTGAGQILKHLLQLAAPDAIISACDISHRMLHRARVAVGSDANRVRFLAADLNRLPFADGSFDLVTCGYVLEHLADPRQGLRELHRVLNPGGSLLLGATEDTFAGLLCGRLWRCRTLNRDELREACAQCGLPWTRQLWLSRGHKLLRMGGILVEARKSAEFVDAIESTDLCCRPERESAESDLSQLEA